MSHDFEINGRAFKLRPLKLRQALKVEAILTGSLFPAIGSIAQGRISAGVLSGVYEIETIVDIFAEACSVDWQGKDVPLAKFLDLVFELKNVDLLLWLAQCVEVQFADFFAESGRQQLKELGSRFTSLLGLTGESGESPQANASPTA